MESFGLYLLKSAVWLTGFSLVFLVVLRNERYFRLNRIYLLSGIVASIVFPLYTWHYAVILPSVQVSYATTPGISTVAVAPPPTAIPIYWWFYLVGMVGIALRLTWQTGMVVRKLRKTGYVKTGSVKLVRTPEYDGSFSFFSFVFVNPSITELETKEIVNHEREHVHQRHWFDLLLVELLCILQWFNPFVWIYARLVRQNHEYLADEMALQHTSNPAIYQATLLNQLLGAPVISLANSFSYSLNKKRFKMMKKKIDSPFRKLRMLLVLPLMVMVFYAFAKPEYITSEPAASTGKITTIAEALNELSVPMNVPADKPETVMQVEKDKIVKGMIVNPGGKPLAGAAVIIKGTSTGTITDRDGNFQLKDVPKDRELVISFVGYATAEVNPDFEKPMVIKMAKQNVGIDGIVVVGYSNVAPPPPPAPAGVTFGSVDFSKNPPLIFLDGVIIDKAKMDAINPNDIESITVSKDKNATDNYGEKGKNGVILITSKKMGFEIKPKMEAPILPLYDSKNPPLILLDGLIIDKAEMDAINPNDIVSIDTLKDKSAIAMYGEKAKNGILQIKSNHPPLYILDGVTIDPANMNVKREDIDHIDVLKGKQGTDMYGEKGKHGVVLIYSKGKAVAPFDKELAKERAGAVIDRELAKKDQINPGELDQKNKAVFTVVEQMPEFPGGVNELRKFIASQIKYPVEAQKTNSQGKVFVTFVVNSNGKVENAKIARGVHPALDAEAIRVVNSLPDWKPGKQQGEAVDVAYTMPIEFKLQ